MAVDEKKTYISDYASLMVCKRSDALEDTSHTVFGDPILITPLQGNLRLVFANGDSNTDLSVGESLIVPPHKTFALGKGKLTASNEQFIQYLVLKIDIKNLNQILSQFAEFCPIPLQAREQWAFGEASMLITHDSQISKVLQKLQMLFAQEQFARNTFIDFTIKELILLLLRSESRDIPEQKPKKIETQNPYHQAMEDTVAYIEAHIDEPISIDELCEKACMSKPTFFRVFKAEFGISPIEYINRVRIKVAKDKLFDLSKSVTDVCYEMGYNHMTYFIKVFKKYVGTTPKQFQKEIANNETQDTDNKK
ncbi:MAG: helix-turn-helix transcriptional regulator [Bernardetiaceae bacterium]|nr:helix-turn-helix transcriptional regulator [Bernardetiaceae bacterium]